MSQRKIKVIGVFAVASASVLGMADPTTNAPPRRLTLTDVARLVGAQNPRVLAERETIAAAKAERLVAAAYPNPKLTTDHLQPGNGERTIFSGDRQEQITVELPILIPGQRSSRIAKADAEIAAAQARF